MGLGVLRGGLENFQYYTEIDFFFSTMDFFLDDVASIVDREIDVAKDRYVRFSNAEDYSDLYHLDPLEEMVNIRSRMEIKNVLYDSIIITTYSFLEKKMLSLGRYISINERIKLNDITGRGIFKLKKYFEIIEEIDFKPIETLWERIHNYNRLRNHLVHSEGSREISKSENKALLRFLKNAPGVSLKENEQSYSFQFEDDKVVREFLSATRKLLRYIYHKEVRIKK